MNSRLLLRLARASWGRRGRSGLGAVAAGIAGVGVITYYGDLQRYLQRFSPAVLAAAPFKGPAHGNRDRFNFVADAVSLAAPSVVYIEIKDKRRVDLYSGEPITMSNGSGFIVGEDGLVLTNAHVVVNAPKAAIQVRLQDGRVFTGRVEHVDMKSDLATLRIPVKGLPVMALGRSSDLRPGEWVVALGSPLALNNTVTAGVVSSVDRGSDELGMSNRDMLYIQTDAAITFGNSGGPLINLDGEAIGINSMKVTSGISFAIPIDYAKQFLSGTKQSPSASKKYLGITMLSLTPDIFKILRQKSHKMASSVTHGVLVWKVILGSPANGSGVYPGDIITHINDTPISSANDVYRLLETEANSSMKMKIVRDNRILELVVQPEDQYN